MRVWREGWVCTDAQQAWDTYQRWCIEAGVPCDPQAQLITERLHLLHVYRIEEASR